MKQKYVIREIAPIIDACDDGHVFAKLADHPKDKNGVWRCPHCMAIGLDVFKDENKMLRGALDIQSAALAKIPQENWFFLYQQAKEGAPDPNRNPHADMIHEWAETGRKVEGRKAVGGFDWALQNKEPFQAIDWRSNWEYRWADEQPKPDVVITSKVVCVKEGIKTLLSVNDPPNVKYTFDADGKLKNVEMIG